MNIHLSNGRRLRKKRDSGPSPREGTGTVAVVLTVLALSGCAAGPVERPLSVREVVENARTLDGAEIIVAGWLEQCGRFSCGIHASAEEVGKDFPYYLSIRSNRWFDSFARRAAPAYIVLRARVHDRCISDPATQTIAACADRAGTLEPLALIR